MRGGCRRVRIATVFVISAAVGYAHHNAGKAIGTPTNPKLQREIGKMLRHAAARVAEGTSGAIRMDRDDLVTAAQLTPLSL
jgi:hypothetical protein